MAEGSGGSCAVISPLRTEVLSFKILKILPAQPMPEIPHKENAIERSSANAQSASAQDTIDWLGENVFKPLYNNAVVEPERAVASVVNSVTGADFVPELDHQSVAEAKSWSPAWCAQAVSNAAGMTIPYLVAGKIAGKAMATGEKFAVSASKYELAGKLLSSEAGAQIVGATVYDAMRMPTGNQWRTTNAAAGAVSFTTFEVGNALASRSNPLLGTAVRLIAGFAGGTSHQLISEGTDATQAKVMQSGVSGAALNALLPVAGRAFARASEELQFAGRGQLSRMLSDLPPEAGQGANRWIGWLSETDRRFKLKGEAAQGHPIPELPMRGNIETANLGIADLNPAQRKGLYLKLESLASPQLKDPAKISSLVDHIYDGTKHWKQQTGAVEAATKVEAGGATVEAGSGAKLDVNVEVSIDPKILKQRGQDVAASVNKFAKAEGKTEITVDVIDQPGVLATYHAGKGVLKVGTGAFEKGEMTPAAVERVAHEYTHALQDTQVIRMLADKHGVGMKPSAEQLKLVKDDYHAATNNTLSDSFVDRIMTDRAGAKLSLSDTLHARKLMQSMGAYSREQPLFARGAMDATLGQIEQAVDIVRHPQGLLILKDAMQEGGGPLIDMMRGTPDYAKHLGTAPGKLLQVGKLLNGDINAVQPATVQNALLDAAFGLQGMRQEAHAKYLRFFFEQEAMSTGTLARIHALKIGG